MKLNLCIGLLFCSSTLAFADQIWQSSTQTQIPSWDDLLQQSSLVVVGENHYDPGTAAVEARVATFLSQSAPTTLGWEFLNLLDKDRVADVVFRLKAGSLDPAGALAELFPNQQAPEEYTALLQSVATQDIDLIPTNLSRAQKQPVTKSGIEAADPALVPPGFAMGSEAYFERFKEAMGPHPLPSPIENYFASQSLTDDVMAYALLSATTPKKVLVTGAFHGDYKQGAVERLSLRAPEEKLLYIKVINSRDYTPEDIQSLLVDPHYGPIADLLYVVEDETKNHRIKP